MLKARKWPSRGINENIRPMLDREGAADLRKTKVVANRQAEIEHVELATDERVAGSKDGALVQRRSGHQMRLAIFGPDISTRIDENLSVVDARTIAIRNASDNRKRKLLCHFLEPRDSAFIPGGCVLLNHRHGIAGIDHFRKDDKFHPGVFRT